MNYLIVGLGNIGYEYENTRHNIGFDVADALAKDLKVNFELKRLAHYTKTKFKGRKVVIIKPTTYMNLSGKALRYWMQMEKVPQENVLVLVDDKDLPLAKLRLRHKGSDAGHNGLKDVALQLGNTNYNRLKFGIGNDFKPGQQVNFVLGKWTTEEKDVLPKAIANSVDIIKSFVASGVQRTMNQYNKK